MAGYTESGDVQRSSRTVLATALLLRIVGSLRFVLDGSVLACGLKGEAVGEEIGSAMGSDDDAKVGSWAGQCGTSARSEAPSCCRTRCNGKMAEGNLAHRSAHRRTGSVGSA